MEGGTGFFVVANLALVGIAAATFLAWLGGYTRAPRPAPKRAVAAALLGVAGGAALAIQVPGDVLLAWFTPLQEGMTPDSLRQLGGHAAHAGDGFHAIVDALGAQRPIPLEGLLRLNIGLWALNAGLFLALAFQILERTWTALFFAAFVLVNPASLASALSELPGQILSTYFSMGVLGAAVSRSDARLPSVLGLLTLFLATALAASVRVETLLIGGPALVGALYGALPDGTLRDRIAGAEARALAAGRRVMDALLDRDRPARFAIGIVVASLVLLSFVTIHEVRPRALVRALNPFDVTVFTLPVTLSLVAPVGVVVLFIAGTAHAIRSWRTFLLLPITFLALYKAYYASSHDAHAFYELFRYQTNMIPLVSFLALFGWREIVVWVERAELGPRALRVSGGLLIAMMFAYSPARIGLTVGRDAVTREAGEDAGLLAMDVQREARFLLRVRRRYPTCRIITPWMERGRRGFEHRGYLVVDAANTESRSTLGLGALIEDERRAGGACLVYFHGLDCNIRGLDTCASDVAGLAPSLIVRFPRAPYGEPDEYGPYEAEVVLGLYPVEDHQH